MKSVNLLLLLIATAFISACSTVNNITGNNNHSSEWNENSTPGHSYASFKDLNREKQFEFKPAMQNSVMIKYHAIIINGKLSIEIRSSSASIFKKDITENVQDSVLINGNGNEKYYFIVNGSHAGGTLDIAYKPAK